MTRRAVLKGVGSALPRNRVSNAALAERIDTSDKWITERTGIRFRHIAEPDETTATLGAQAARKAMDSAGILPHEIGMIIVATATPDNVFPASATKVQALLGIDDCIAFDVGAVCSGFVYALSVADAMMKAGQANHTLVIGADTLTRLLDWQDRTTCVLFGDGAGAILLSAEENDKNEQKNARGILATKLHAKGRYGKMLYVDGGPSTTSTMGHIRMQGREVFRHAVTNLASVLGEVMEITNMRPSDVDWVIPHQANLRIIEATTRKLGLDPARVVTTVDQHANTSAASVPLALDFAIADGRIKEGDICVLEAMGGGFAWGAAVLRI